MPALVALLEVPAIVVGLVLARSGKVETEPDHEDGAGGVSWGDLLHEVLTGRSILLLVGGVALGWIAGPERMEPVNPFFVAGFQGALTLFLLEMGLVAARRLRDLREAGFMASASYIAAPAAVRMALPEAKPSIYLTASLGITFPFNLVLGIPMYFALARMIGG